MAAAAEAAAGACECASVRNGSAPSRHTHARSALEIGEALGEFLLRGREEGCMRNMWAMVVRAQQPPWFDRHLLTGATHPGVPASHVVLEAALLDGGHEHLLRRGLGGKHGGQGCVPSERRSRAANAAAARDTCSPCKARTCCRPLRCAWRCRPCRPRLRLREIASSTSGAGGRRAARTGRGTTRGCAELTGRGTGDLFVALGLVLAGACDGGVEIGLEEGRGGCGPCGGREEGGNCGPGASPTASSRAFFDALDPLPMVPRDAEGLA